MSNLAISNPFQYLEQNLNVNLLKGISTTLIESDFFSLLPLYCFGNHSANKYTEASKSTLIEREENDECNIWIQLSDADVIEINSDLSCSTSKLNQELKEELKSAISYDNLEQQESAQNKRRKDDYDTIFEENNSDNFSESSGQPESIHSMFEYPASLRQHRRNLGTKHKDKLMRWGKKHDKVLWNVLKELEINSKESYDMIVSSNSIDLAKHQTLLSSLCSKSQWKGTIEKFLRRVKKLTLKNGFSFRENKKLKTLLRRGIRNKKIDINEIAKEFPGKENLTILSEIKKIKSNYKIMQNIHIADSDNCLHLLIN